MSNQHKIQIEYINPTKIECEVPKQQKLRETNFAHDNQSQNASNQPRNGGNQVQKYEQLQIDDNLIQIVDNESASYVPVITIKKEESAFTKGDLKLQKVSVTEDISKPNVSMSHKVSNPLYSEVQGEVLEGHQIRPAPKHHKNGDQEESRTKSKIPRFRQEVEKLKERRRQSIEMKDQEVTPNQPRRSSIPRLRRTRLPSLTKETIDNQSNVTQEKYKSNQENINNNQELVNTQQQQDTKLQQNENHEEVLPEDEFDKIYEEIVHNVEDKLIIDTKLVDKVEIEDAKSLEYSFEEIIHDYEENKVKPIDLKQIRSRIPLVKQKSLPEEQVVKKIERRLSLKDISIDDVKEQTKEEGIKSNALPKPAEKDSRKPIIESKLNIEFEEVNIVPKRLPVANSRKSDEDHELAPNTLVNDDLNTTTREQSRNNEINIKDGSILNSEIQKFQIVNVNPVTKESIKIATPVFNKVVRDSAEPNKINSDNSFQKTKVIDELKYMKPEKNTDTKVLTTQDPASIEKRKELINIPEKKQEIKQGDQIIAKGKVSQLLTKIKTSELNSTPITRQFSSDIPKKSSILSKIAVFSRDSNIKNDKSNTVPKGADLIGTKTDVNEDVNLLEKQETSNLVKKIRKNSKEKCRYVRSESVPTDCILRMKHNTPPNTPQNEIQELNNYDTESEMFINDTDNKTTNFNRKCYNENVVRNNSKKKLPKTISESNVSDISTPEELKALDNDTFKEEITQHQSILPFHKDQVYDQDTFLNNCESYDSQATNLIQHNSVTENVHTENLNVINIEINEEKNQTISKPIQINNMINEDAIPKNTHSVTNSTLDLGNSVNMDDLCEADNNEEDDVKNNFVFEENFVLKGKVNRIINKLHSVDESVNVAKKEVIEIPVKKSVSSRIAMFEHQEKHAEPKFYKKCKIGQPLPRIIDQVLKPQPRQDQPYDKDTKDNNFVLIIEKDNLYEKQDYSLHLHSRTTEDTKTNIDENKSDKNNMDVIFSQETTDIVQKEEIIDGSDVRYEVIDVNEINDDDRTKNQNIEIIDDFGLDTNKLGNELHEAVNVIQNQYNKETDNFFGDENLTKTEVHENNLDNGTELPDHFNNNANNNILIKKDDMPKGNNKYGIFKSQTSEVIKIQTRNEGNNLKKAKSMAELELFKGKVTKVHEMIVRMNSMEKLDLEKKNNVINVKERPRRNSVSEKIALFERKLISQEMEPIRKSATVPTTGSTEAVQTNDIDYTTLIEDLKKAKDEYGTDNDMIYVTLRNGEKMPVVALGTALLDSVLLPHVVSAAIDLGYRAIDTAYIYGNEKVIGESIRAKIDDGTVKREDLFIIGKLWSTHHRRDLVEAACRSSLEALHLQYFDLYLIHNPMSFKEGPDPFPKIANVLQYSDIDYLGAWFGMEDLVSKGLAKSIGVSNFNSEQISRVMDKGRIKPVINQVECHPYLNQLRLDGFCSDRDIKLMCFGTLGSKGTPDDLKNSKTSVIDDPLVKVMAAGLNITPAQLLIRYQIESGHAVVVKSSKPHHLKDILKAMHINITSAEIDALDALNRNKRTYNFKGMGDTHRNYPFKIPF